MNLAFTGDLAILKTLLVSTGLSRTRGEGLAGVLILGDFFEVDAGGVSRFMRNNFLRVCTRGGVGGGAVSADSGTGGGCPCLGKFAFEAD